MKKLKEAIQAVGVMDLVPYQMRHSGPSIDRVKGRRSLDECRKRGRWQSWRSLVRYEKAARLGHAWNMLSATVRSRLLVCERSLEALLLKLPSAPVMTWAAPVGARPARM